MRERDFSGRIHVIHVVYDIWAAPWSAAGCFGWLVPRVLFALWARGAGGGQPTPEAGAMGTVDDSKSVWRALAHVSGRNAEATEPDGGGGSISRKTRAVLEMR